MNLTFPETIYEDIGFKLKDYLLDNCRVYKWSLEKPLQHIDRYYFRETDLEIIRKISEEQDILKQTLMLRSAFKSILNDKELKEDELNQYFFWIINAWGGVNIGNSSELSKTINKIIKCKENDSSIFEFDRIASWSKVLSFKFPIDCAIYDYRVIYSLNWYLYLAGATKFLPFPSGRNSIINLMQFELQLYFRACDEIQLKKFFVDRLTKKMKSTKSGNEKILSTLKKKVFFEKNHAYRIYCGLLSNIKKSLCEIKVLDDDDEWALTKIEMVLFGIADTVIPLEILELTKSLKN